MVGKFYKMNQVLTPIIEVEELKNLRDSEDLILVDASYGKNSFELYLVKHLQGAIFVDLDSQLSEVKEDAADGGRHPLPSIGNFSKTIGSLGITPESHVVIYDQANGALATSRFWWMLKAIGHQKVQVLNGGLAEAEKQNFPTNNEKVQPKPTSFYPVENWKLPMATMSEVESVSTNEDYTLIDVRASNRYRGEIEPIDPIAGHIPGAINIPLSENLDETNLFLPKEELKLKYQNILGETKTENTIIHCGSGVTACHTLLALNYAGFEMPKLYVGSWSEWCRNNKAIATAN